jgi:hypothetical protein
MAYVLWQQRCLEVASRLHHVGFVDETRRTYRHHGRQRDRASAHRNVPPRDAARRTTSLRKRLSRWGSLAACARLARTVPLRRLWLRDGHVSEYMRADEFAASRRVVIERRDRLKARPHRMLALGQYQYFGEGLLA